MHRLRNLLPDRENTNRNAVQMPLPRLYERPTLPRTRHRGFVLQWADAGGGGGVEADYEVSC